MVGSTGLRRYRSLGLLMVATFALGRVILVPPFIAQPRLYSSPLRVIGSVILGAAIIFSLPVLRIRPFTGPEATVGLRNCWLLWDRQKSDPPWRTASVPGLSVIFGSVIGIVLVPVWWASFLFPHGH